MNENLNLCEILNGCPKGTKLYSPFLGDCEFDRIVGDNIYVIANRGNVFFYHDATLRLDCTRSSEPMLFPSKEVRTWDGFKVKKPKFDPSTLQPFDRVLIIDSDYIWQCELFSHVRTVEPEGWCQCLGDYYCICIPYNEDTKHLVGTTEEAPEFYRYWEE